MLKTTTIAIQPLAQFSGWRHLQSDLKRHLHEAT